MAGLGVVTIVDLRRKSEREREPSRRPPDFTGRVIDNDIGDVGVAPHMTFVADDELTTPTSVRAFMIEEYRRIPFEPRHLDLSRRYSEALASAEGPVVIHCAAGKDRTGLLAALTHKVVGVHDDDIYEDYILTNVAARIEEQGHGLSRPISARRPAVPRRWRPSGPFSACCRTIWTPPLPRSASGMGRSTPISNGPSASTRT
jgi:protein tyrosine/serine phosphatase